MTDTMVEPASVRPDTTVRFKLTKAAAERAKAKLGLRRYDDVAKVMGLSRRSFYRLLEGTYSISLADAVAFCEQIGWPVTRAFERVSDEQVAA